MAASCNIFREKARYQKWRIVRDESPGLKEDRAEQIKDVINQRNNVKQKARNCFGHVYNRVVFSLWLVLAHD